MELILIIVDSYADVSAAVGTGSGGSPATGDEFGVGGDTHLAAFWYSLNFAPGTARQRPGHCRQTMVFGRFAAEKWRCHA